MRFDIAGATRVGVVAPRAAHIVGALQDDEVVDSFVLQTDCGTEPTEPTADDGNACVHGSIIPSRVRPPPALTYRRAAPFRLALKINVGRLPCETVDASGPSSRRRI